MEVDSSESDVFINKLYYKSYKGNISLKTITSSANLSQKLLFDRYNYHGAKYEETGFLVFLGVEQKLSVI